MKRLFLFLITLIGTGGLARASLVFTLDFPTYSGAPGDSIDITGSLLNPDADPIFVNNFSGFLASPDLDFDLTDFFTLVPGVFNSGDTYAGPLVTILVDDQAQPGDYFASITLQGGADGDAFDDLATQNFQFTVQGTPEPSPVILFGIGVVFTLFIQSRRLALRARRAG